MSSSACIWNVVSTPSATTSIPRLCARVITALGMAV